VGLGASVTNSVEYIWADLVDRHGEPLLLLEHYPASEQMPGDGDTLDQVAVLDGRPVWRRVADPAGEPRPRDARAMDDQARPRAARWLDHQLTRRCRGEQLS
jgi:hypothetical protein